MKRSRFSRHLFPVEEESLLNLTPLIDVVFVVLIIFILIAPMLETDKISLASGRSDSHKEQSPLESSPITLHVKEDNSIWLQGLRIQPEQLLPLLQKAKASHPSRAPQLFQDKKAQFGVYQMIKNAVEDAGFDELDIILQPGSS